MTQASITEADLRRLYDALPLMSEAEQSRALELLRTELGDYRGFRSNRIIDIVRPPFVPHPRTGQMIPGVSPKQRMFLNLDVIESLFGGSVGGAKSDALLIAGLQYVDVPGYSALLLRKTKKDLGGAGGVLDRAKDWLAPFRVTGEAKWDGEQSSFFFQTSGRPSRLTFGYVANENDCYQYKSHEYQFIGWDEVTEQLEWCYLFMFSRLRRLLTMLNVPLRVRAATNPGGQNPEWVRERFVADAYIDANPETRFSKVWTKGGECGDCGGTGTLNGQTCVYCDGAKRVERFFVPARIQDNPFIDERSYRKSLMHLSDTTRKQYEDGDWDVVDEGKFFQRDWLLHYRMQGTSFILRDSRTVDGTEQKHDRIIAAGETTTFLTGDTASKLNDWNDFTVFMVWTMSHRSYDLMLRYAWRARIEIPDQMPRLKAIYRGDWPGAKDGANNVLWPCAFAIIEEASSGIALVQEAHTMRGEGVTIVPYNPNKAVPGTDKRDKLSRATVPQQRLKAGQIWVPADAPPWLSNVLREILEFDGDDEKHDDCVDNWSMAADYAASGDNMSRKTRHDPPEIITRGMVLPPRIF
jgi:phage terminase large subunit-like protein